MVNLAKLRKKVKDGKKPAEPAMPEPAPPEPAPEVPRPQRETEAGPDKIAAYLASAGEARVEARAKGAATATGTRLELLSFVIAGEQYAIDIENVVEIVTPRPVTRIPNADLSILGILSLRGTIVMLVDARRRLGHPAAAGTTPDARIVVVQDGSENIGFLVDRVLRVVKLDAEDLQAHPVVHSSEQDASVRGVFRQGDSLTILLDLNKLVFSNDEWN